MILLTDGEETCASDTNTRNAAAELRATTVGGVAYDIRTYVIGFGVSPGTYDIEQIAVNGGTDAPGPYNVYYASDETSLSLAFSQIIEDSILTEVCNGADDDCDGLVDEGYTLYCDWDGTGSMPTPSLCTDPGESICDGLDNNCDGLVDEGLLNACGECGPTPTEICDGLDNDCDGAIDEGDVCAGCIPSAEICDGLDNDCDGSIDEGLTRVCGTDVGECTPGTQTCTAGTWGACTGTGPTTETCNGLDDDCDGVTDGISQPCGEDRGECQAGMQLCIGGAWGACTGEVGPTAEVCDGLDNDCDDAVDEGTGGGACGSSIGACEPGTYACMAGVLVCTGGTSPSPETCDGVDEDCDGLTDEGNPGGGADCGATDVGECDFGTVQCVSGSLACVGAIGPEPEVCDGLDNDCDTMVDEGDPGGGDACGDDTGECEAGVTRCISGSLTCDGAVGPTAEVCNGLDDDCDGVPDDGLAVGAPCGSDVGECSPGMNVCVGGSVECVGAVGPIDEECDLLDNDCDGAVDEDLPVGESCGTDEGICTAGMIQCVSGREICVGEVPPMREACDCDDNDCDGLVDEPPDTGMLCPEGSACVDCQCALPCTESEFGFMCPSGKVPRIEDDGCYCVRDRCNEETCAGETHPSEEEPRCAPDSDELPSCVCKNNECTFPCDGVVCPEGLRCRPDDGTCVEDSCRSLGCPAGEVCDVASGDCVDDPCVTAGCATDEACRGGTCEPSCARVSCAAGERCEHGECVDDRCADVSCESGEVCDPAGGECVDDMCGTITCPPASLCDPGTGTCRTDPCIGLSCPDGERCAAGECVEIGTGDTDAGMPDAGGIDAGRRTDAGTGGGRLTDRVIATGGGGCVCAVPGRAPDGAPGPAAGLALVGVLGGLGAWRRRRRAGKAARRGGE